MKTPIFGIDTKQIPYVDMARPQFIGPQFIARIGLLVMTKRLDTGSPWPISNNPNGKYFKSKAGGTVANGEYPLWKVVRASTAAPSYFDPETITIIDKPHHIVCSAEKFNAMYEIDEQ